MLGKSQSLSGSTLQMDEKFSILRSGLSKVFLTDAKNWLKPQTSQFHQKQNYLSREKKQSKRARKWNLSTFMIPTIVPL